MNLALRSNLILNNRFVSAEELVEHVGAADIYITPYRQEAQVVSGTLAIALGAGKAIISTPYWHAKELLAEKRGVIVPFDRSRRDRGSCSCACWITMQSATRCASAPIFTRAERRGPRRRRAYMASFQRARLERCRSQRPPAGRRRSRLSSLAEHLPMLNMQPSAGDDRRHGNVAARDFHCAQYPRRLHDRRQRARADCVHAAG